MSVLPRCTCDQLDAMVGKYDPRCNRHLGLKRPMMEEKDIDGLIALLHPSNADLRQRAGEMTAQELRSVRAVLVSLAPAIRAYAESIVRKEVRLLTSEEIIRVVNAPAQPGDFYSGQAIQREFARVNGLKVKE